MLFVFACASVWAVYAVSDGHALICCWYPLQSYSSDFLWRFYKFDSPEAFGDTVGISGASAATFGEGANCCCTEEGPKYSKNTLGQKEAWIRSGVDAFFWSELLFPKGECCIKYRMIAEDLWYHSFNMFSDKLRIFPRYMQLGFGVGKVHLFNISEKQLPKSSTNCRAEKSLIHHFYM